jgi:biopolymer transport protein ExbD
MQRGHCRAANGVVVMRRWGEEKSARARIEIIPMIDVMMFLLVFFVLISINVIPALGLRTTLPRSGQAEKLSLHKRAVITLTKDGAVQLDGKTMGLEQLNSVLSQRKAQGENLDITINGDESVKLQRLVDVFDVLKSGGFDNVAIATEKRA